MFHYLLIQTSLIQIFTSFVFIHSTTCFDVSIRRATNLSPKPSLQYSDLLMCQLFTNRLSAKLSTGSSHMWLQVCTNRCHVCLWKRKSFVACNMRLSTSMWLDPTMQSRFQMGSLCQSMQMRQLCYSWNLFLRKILEC